ncbi:unnamed protein product [Ectocarpus sp. 6 AP-2014]
MALAASSRALRVVLKRPCQLRGGLPDASCSLALLHARPTQHHRQAAAAFHSSTMLLDRGDKRGESHNSSVDNGDKEGDTGSADESKPASVRSLSMTDKDKPDVVDLADLIMSGTSYEEAVKGTEFDALDKETSKEFEESTRRLTALRENRLEEYLEETGETDLLDKVRAIYGEPETSEQTDGPAPPKKKKTVEMAQGQWAEILVHTDRVTKTVKGGMEIQYRALVTVGNLHGVGGFAIGKADTPAVAITEASRKAKLLHNLVYVERYKQASLCQDLVGKHNGSKVYIWSRPPGSGMRAGKLSRDILYNMGITDGACKIIGRRNKYSMIYAMFDALAKHRGIESIARGRGKRILSLQREMAGRFA